MNEAYAPTKQFDAFLQKIKFDKWKAWIYLLPTLICLAIFTFWPIVNTVRMAFTVYWDAEAPVYAYDEEGNIITDDDTGKKVILEYGQYKGYNIALDIAGETDFEFGFSNFIFNFCNCSIKFFNAVFALFSSFGFLV